MYRLLLSIVLGLGWLWGAVGCVSATETPPPQTASCAPCYVAPGGDDAHEGTSAAPWATIQHAAEVLAPGNTVYVRGGVYHEQVVVSVSGSQAGGYITFTNAPGETPILDGTGITSPDGPVAIHIVGQHYLTFHGFEIRNYTTTHPNAVPAGFLIAGAAHHLRLLDNHIHHIETHAPLDAQLLGADAHGVAFYGDDESPLHDVWFSGNEVDHLVLGSSEAVAFNGNVTSFTVTHNLIHDCNNIGLVFIGYEETAPSTELDQARNGWVSQNTIHDIDSGQNPSYAGDQSADGIYVDGGRDILIERNTVYSANLGIELASEHAGGLAQRIIVRDNLVAHCHVAGLAMGGYDEDRGSTEHCVVINNTFFHNDQSRDGNGELMLQYQVLNNRIEDNIFYAHDQAILISNQFTENSGNVVDYNLYFAPLGAEACTWQWRGTTYDGFSAYRQATGNDAHSLFADPRLVDGVRLQPDSPAIDAGQTLSVTGTVDYDGEPRVQGDAVDIGSDEFQPQQLYLPLLLHAAA